MRLQTARTMIAAAFEEAATAGFQPLAVAVLDAGGHLTAFERQDGAANMRFQIAHGKAHGARALGIGSRALMNRAEQQPYFVTAAAGAVGGALVPVPGGVLVKDDQATIVGAVGISGDTSDNDERAAVAAIKAVGFAADTG
jgi:uncharacterized protein GlcG (DUF336 family)